MQIDLIGSGRESIRIDLNQINMPALMKAVDFIAHLFLGDISKLIPFKLYRHSKVIIINAFLTEITLILNNKP